MTAPLVVYSGGNLKQVLESKLALNEIRTFGAKKGFLSLHGSKQECNLIKTEIGNIIGVDGQTPDVYIQISLEELDSIATYLKVMR